MNSARLPLRLHLAALRSLGVLFFAVLAALLGSGCASLPEPAARPSSSVIAPSPEAPLVRAAARSTPPGAGRESGFRLLADGDHAFDARLALARRAVHTLDIQYYLVADDDIGRRFAAELVAAARRGVRVRLLGDDLYSGTSQALLAGLAAQPGIEVRLFNPLPVRGTTPGGRVLRSIHEFDRINRRMHNKLFIADAALAIAGGRNIADDYFKRGEPSNFIDMDVLATGPVVRELGELFDRFWNAEPSWPLRSLLPAADGEATWVPPATPPADLPVAPFDRFGHEPLTAQLETGWLELRFAPARLLADAPDKAGADPATPAPAALEEAIAQMLAARREVLIATPYLVPGERGLALMRQAAARGIRMTVMTNAFAATDEPLVHWGYARYRRAMLELGVELHELSPTLGRQALTRGEARSSLGRLHAKLAVIDRERLLIGSMNMDARSMRANTEIALLIDSAALADEVARTLRLDRDTATYRLRSAAGSKGIEWVSNEAGHEVVHRREPDAGWTTRLKLELISLFVDEQLL